MALLLDASLWIDFSRRRSPRHLKELIAPYILAPDACVAEPVVFEVLRHATAEELAQLQTQFEVMPMLATPSSLWRDAGDLGRRCRNMGVNASSLDRLVASIALHHGAELVTFDVDFDQIAAVCSLRVNRLIRPAV